MQARQHGSASQRQGVHREVVALYAKNGAAKTLGAAVGREVRARYRPMDKGLFAVAVEVVA